MDGYGVGKINLNFFERLTMYPEYSLLGKMLRRFKRQLSKATGGIGLIRKMDIKC